MLICPSHTTTISISWQDWTFHTHYTAQCIHVCYRILYHRHFLVLVTTFCTHLSVVVSRRKTDYWFGIKCGLCFLLTCTSYLPSIISSLLWLSVYCYVPVSPNTVTTLNVSYMSMLFSHYYESRSHTLLPTKYSSPRKSGCAIVFCTLPRLSNEHPLIRPPHVRNLGTTLRAMRVLLILWSGTYDAGLIK